MTEPMTTEGLLLAALAAVFGNESIDGGTALYRARFRPELNTAIAAVMPRFQARPGLIPRRLIDRFTRVLADLAKRGYLPRRPAGRQVLR